MKNAISYFIRKMTDFAVRRRSPALALARLGFYLAMAALGGGWLVSAKHQGTSGIWELAIPIATFNDENIQIFAPKKSKFFCRCTLNFYEFVRPLKIFCLAHK